MKRAARFSTEYSPNAPELEWEVGVERADPQHITYWLTVHNLTNQPINFEGRYAVLN